MLASIIIVSLKGMFRQFSHLPKYFRQSHSDALVWAVTFVATVVFDVDVGLVAGVAVNVCILISIILRPVVEIVEQTDYADVSLSPESYHDVRATKNIVAVRLAGHLNFANAARTEKAVEEKLDRALAADDGVGGPDIVVHKAKAKQNGSAPVTPEPSLEKTPPVSSGETLPKKRGDKFYLILDMSGVSGIDPSGCRAIVNIKNKVRTNRNVHLALVGLSG